MTREEWEALKGKPGTNAGFDVERFGRFFDKEGRLLPGMLAEWLKEKGKDNER